MRHISITKPTIYKQHFTELAVRRSSRKLVFVKISQKSQDNTLCIQFYIRYIQIE